jgi:hypothetical protein
MMSIKQQQQNNECTAITMTRWTFDSDNDIKSARQ